MPLIYILLAFLPMSHCQLKDTSICNVKDSSCYRNAAFYFQEGKLCYNAENSGDCGGNTIWGVNINGGEHKDARGIDYVAGLSYPVIDSKGFALYGKTLQICYSIEGEQEREDKNKLFGTFMIGDITKKAPGECVSYLIPICEDGMYELSLKTLDPYSSDVNLRKFDVKINGVIVLEALDIISLVGKRCRPAEIILSLTVQNGAKLVISGIENQQLLLNNGLMDLQFCYTNSPVLQPVFMIGAISLFKFGTAQLETEADKKCAKYNGNQCSCKCTACEYNKIASKCIGAKKQCSKCTLDCRRPNVWYSEGGIFCRSDVSQGNCARSKVIMAVNFAGGSFTDSNGVTYSAYNDVPQVLPYPHVKVYKSYNWESVVGVPKHDQYLYGTYVRGHSKDPDLLCLKYSVPMPEDGRYELNIKFGDFWHDSTGKRAINYRFNGLYIAAEMDMRRYADNKYQGLDVNVNFLVKKNVTVLYLPGYPISLIKDRQILLEFCYGTCSPSPFEESNWHASAWSVVQFGKENITYGNGAI